MGDADSRLRGNDKADSGLLSRTYLVISIEYKNKDNNRHKPEEAAVKGMKPC